MKELVRILNEASEYYYSHDTQIMSDRDYDKLYDELLELEADTGLVLSGSPTQRVGSAVIDSLKKVKHGQRMLSLDKTKEVSKLASFLNEGGADHAGVLSWKLDGLTIVLTYKDGGLAQAITRGNGEIGEDVTHNARVFKNIPLKIDFKGELIIRGEAVISYSDFKKINEGGLEIKYKNPRNLTSGTVRQLDSAVAAKRSVCFFAFSVFRAEGMDFGDSKMERLVWLKKLGFDVVEFKTVETSNVIEAVEDFRKKIDRNDFASDGLVLTYDSISFSESLGRTSKFPKDSIAFKWADETAETKLIKIDWNTSRTGLINPVAIFEPVELEGTTVNKASLHNVSILESLELGPGDTISVYKANMIIPQVAENLTRSGGCKIPGECPVCHFDTEISEANETKSLYCTNPNCRAQLVRSLSHFSSRDAMNIEGLSEATIEKFVGKNFLENYTDIYSLEKYADEIKKMDGFGEKSYAKIIDAIEKSKDVALPNFIYALGINHVGLAGAKLLCKHFNNDIKKIIRASSVPMDTEPITELSSIELTSPELISTELTLTELTSTELTSIEGFGEVISNSIVKYFSDEKNLSLVEKALKIIRLPEVSDEPESPSAPLKLEGLTFVITGDVHHFKNRKELSQYIESHGGKVTGSVTGKTNYLINNDSSSGSSKNKKARELGVEILSEEEFMDLLTSL